MKGIRFLPRWLQQRVRQRELEKIHARFSDFTMIPPAGYLANLRLAQRIGHLPGCVVECGVWRGGMIAGLATILGAQRDYYLFDSFQGLPPAAPVDGEAALQWQRNPAGENYHDNCTAPPEYARRAMALSGAARVELFPGWFNETLPKFSPREPIALLRLDADWYESTMTCLENLYPRMAPGGLILVDDYYTWDGCSRAVHDFLSQRKAVERIHSEGGVAFLIKAADAPVQP